MANNVDNMKKAEEFADRMEAQMRKMGSVADFFCDAQRQRWRQHAIRAYLGSAGEAATAEPSSYASASDSHE
jgi:hypothetical protein